MTKDMIPLAVARYLAARTPGEIAECFTADGIALDERRTHRGRAAIREWREEVAKISYRQEILSARSEDRRVVVTCRLTGDFRGSPVELDYRFDLSAGRIAKLEIA